jgi:hypothetical protein
VSTKPSRRPRGKTKEKVVKKSLSFTPVAWKAIDRLAKARARKDGTKSNYSEAASTLVCYGAQFI